MCGSKQFTNNQNQSIVSSSATITSTEAKARVCVCVCWPTRWGRGSFVGNWKELWIGGNCWTSAWKETHGRTHRGESDLHSLTLSAAGSFKGQPLNNSRLTAQPTGDSVPINHHDPTSCRQTGTTEKFQDTKLFLTSGPKQRLPPSSSFSPFCRLLAVNLPQLHSDKQSRCSDVN